MKSEIMIAGYFHDAQNADRLILHILVCKIYILSATVYSLSANYLFNELLTHQLVKVRE